MFKSRLSVLVETTSAILSFYTVISFITYALSILGPNRARLPEPVDWDIIQPSLSYFPSWNKFHCSGKDEMQGFNQ
jgi:hypothetical protein